MLKESMFVCPRRLTKNMDFRKWFFSTEGELWVILESKIIRKPNDKGYEIPNYVYKNFYKKGKLATSWSLEALAAELGYGSSGKSNVCKIIKRLEQKRLLKKHVVYIKNKKTTIYELGYIHKQQNIEILYVYEKFKVDIKDQEFALYNESYK